MPGARCACATGAERPGPDRARPAAAPARNVPGDGAPGARQIQSAERAVQALGNTGSKHASKPDDRRAHAGDRRRVAGTVARGTAGRVCRWDLLANQAPPLPVPGGDDPVSDTPPLPGPLSGLRVLELADE